ncbi:MAG TPA: rhomboid family intramembrane serine protease [Planctomycetota bacterium]|nr:rhomboid family intramembrane serine protease [Planctomycetota bacterium]
MVLPLGDDNRDRRSTPVVNYLLIAANVLVFVLLQGGGENVSFTMAWSAVPQEIVTGHDVVTPSRMERDPLSGETFPMPGLGPTPISVYLTLLTSIFMHGSWAHLLGNMLFLWIFGDNVEDRLGRGRYLVFYLTCGVLASLAHVLTTVALDQDRLVPSLGASGAISGVLAGYMLLFPQRRVRVLLVRVITDVPAWVAVGIWFAFQLVSGIGLLGGGAQAGGVAYGAHIGGFLAGLVLVRIFAIGTGGGAALASRRG